MFQTLLPPPSPHFYYIGSYPGAVSVLGPFLGTSGARLLTPHGLVLTSSQENGPVGVGTSF